MDRQEITIREYRAGDEKALTRIFNQVSVARETLQIPYTAEEERHERFQPSPALRRIVAEIDGRIVGSASLSLGLRRRAHSGSLGMGVDEAFHSRGVGTAMMTTLIDLADNWYNLRRLELEVYTDNAPAIRLYERFGFEVEGTLRSFAWRNGSYADAYVMSRLRDESPVIRHDPHMA